MKFSIRDLLLLTLIVALAIGWWLDRSVVARREREAAKELESYQALTDALTRQMQNKNPAASIEISVNGQGVVTSTGYGEPSKTVVDWRKAKPSASSPNPPKE